MVFDLPNLLGIRHDKYSVVVATIEKPQLIGNSDKLNENVAPVANLR